MLNPALVPLDIQSTEYAHIFCTPLSIVMLVRGDGDGSYADIYFQNPVEGTDVRLALLWYSLFACTHHGWLIMINTKHLEDLFIKECFWPVSRLKTLHFLISSRPVQVSTVPSAIN